MFDNDATNTEVEVNDLDTFSQEFFDRAPKKKEVEVKAEEPVEEIDEELDDSNESTDEGEDPELDDTTVADETDDAEEEPEEEPKSKSKSKKKSVQDRIDELTREREDAKRALAAERSENARRIEALELKLNPPAVEVQRVEDTTGPNPDDKNDKGEDLYPLGEFDPGYIRALARHTIQIEQAAAERFRQEREQQQAMVAARETQRVKWVEKLEAESADTPDIVEKITAVTNEFSGIEEKYGQYLVDVIQSLDNGPKVLAYLADNPAEARKIVSSGPASATVMLGRLDAITAKPKKPEATKVITKAKPVPPKTVRGNQGRFTTRADTDDLDAFSDAFFGR